LSPGQEDPLAAAEQGCGEPRSRLAYESHAYTSQRLGRPLEITGLGLERELVEELLLAALQALDQFLAFGCEADQRRALVLGVELEGDQVELEKGVYEALNVLACDVTSAGDVGHGPGSLDRQVLQNRPHAEGNRLSLVEALARLTQYVPKQAHLVQEVFEVLAVDERFLFRMAHFVRPAGEHSE
jgi:hypothetical protein